MVKLGIIGATGYVGVEIVRLVRNHPRMEISTVISQTFSGKKMSDIYPGFNKVFDMPLNSLDIDKVAKNSDIIVTALPHGVSSKIVPQLFSKGKRVLDHSGDFRYNNINIYEKSYALTHNAPELINYSVYGIPELYREKIKNTKIVGNPGCYPTCAILGIAPLLSNKIVNTNNIIINGVSGVTGAGRTAKHSFQFSECDENFKAYKVVNHRHTSEIEQELSLIAGEEISVSFTPHLAPMKRGMMCTIYANLQKECTANSIIAIYNEFYKNDFFVRVYEKDTLPETKYVTSSNFIDIGVTIDERLNRVIVTSCLDNLVKGAAGQAIQALNIMVGLDEKTGLDSPGMQL